MVMEARSEVAGKSVTRTGKKVLPLIRSLSRNGQYGVLAKKAPIGTAHTAIDRWGQDGDARATTLTLNTSHVNAGTNTYFTITRLVIWLRQSL